MLTKNNSSCGQGNCSSRKRCSIPFAVSSDSPSQSACTRLGKITAQCCTLWEQERKEVGERGGEGEGKIWVLEERRLLLGLGGSGGGETHGDLEGIVDEPLESL